MITYVAYEEKNFWNFLLGISNEKNKRLVVNCYNDDHGNIITMIMSLECRIHKTQK